MFDKLANGWELTKASFRVLWLDKELLVFPMLSGVACLLVIGSFALPLFFSGAFQIDNQVQCAVHNPLAYVVLFAYYFINYFVIVYFNSALVACAIIRFTCRTSGSGASASPYSSARASAPSPPPPACL